jgi:trigger factor
LKVTQEDELESQVVLNIEVDAEELDKYLNRAYLKIVGKLRIPGFRKGKASRDIVERFVGRDTLIRDALEFLVPEVTAIAVKDKQLEACTRPRIEILGLDPVSFKATIAVNPEVKLNQYLDLRLDFESVNVSDDQVEKALEEIQHSSAPWEPVDRPLKVDDLLTIDVTGEVEGKVVINNKDLQFLPASNPALPVPGFGDALIDANKGDARDFVLPVPDDDPNSEIAGQNCKFSVSVNEIKQKKLADLNDDFAKGVGDGYENIAELRKAVRDNLTEEGEKAAASHYQHMVLKTLAEEMSEVSLPSILVEDEVLSMKKEQQDAVNRGQAGSAQYMDTAGKSDKDIEEYLRPRAIERLTNSFVLAKLAEEEGINVEDDEVDKEIESMIKRAGPQEQVFRDLFKDESRKDRLSLAIKDRKALERLAEIAKGPRLVSSSGERIGNDAKRKSKLIVDTKDGGD